LTNSNNRYIIEIKRGDNMPDYKELFYKSQAQLADIAEKLRELADEIEHKMQCTGEEN
jgi:hypothetical protein